MTRILCAVSFLALFILCGCSFMEREPFRTTIYFDIVPTSQELHQDIGVSSLVTSSSMQFSDRMLFRVGTDKLEFDEYNRWIASPETLLKRYLEISFAPAASGKVSAQIKLLRFELDKPGRGATCELLLTLVKGGVTFDAVRISSSAKAKGDTVSDFVEAMHSAVSAAAAKIAAEIKKANG